MLLAPHTSARPFSLRRKRARAAGWHQFLTGYDPLNGSGLPWKAVAWAGDPTLGYADGDSVPSWSVYGVEAGKHLTQGTGGLQPTFRASDPDFNDRAVIDADGTEWLQTADFGSALAQPWLSILVAKADVLTSRVFMDGNDATNRGLFWIDAGDNWEISNGTVRQAAGGDTSVHRFVVVANGATSELQIDGVTTIGPIDAGAASIDGVTLFANQGGAARLDGKIAFFGLIPAAATITHASELGIFNSWLVNYYGLS